MTDGAPPHLHPRPPVPLYQAGMRCHQCGGTNFWVRAHTAECGNSRCAAVYQTGQIPAQSGAAAEEEQENGVQ